MGNFLSVERTTMEEKEGLDSLRHWRVRRLETLKRRRILTSLSISARKSGAVAQEKQRCADIETALW